MNVFISKIEEPLNCHIIHTIIQNTTLIQLILTTIQTSPSNQLQSNYMEPARNRTATCQYCHTAVPRSLIEIHARRCFATISKSNSSVQALMNKPEERGKKEAPRRKTWEEEQRFQCYLCGKMQTISQLDDHIEQCPNRQIQCQDCHLKVPRNLFSEHRTVCEGPQLSSQQEQQQIVRRRFGISDVSEDQQDQDSYPEDESGHYEDGSGISDDSQDYDDSDEDESSIEIQQDSTISRRRSDLQRRLRQQFGQRHMNERRIHQIQIEMEELRNQIRRRARNADVRRKGGMSKTEIDNLPTKVFKFDGRNKQTCSVCYTDFTHNQVVKDIECNHLFHVECITPWLLKNKTCPNCKRVVKAKPKLKKQQVRSQNKPETKSKPEQQRRTQTFSSRISKAIQFLFRDTSSQHDN